MCGICLIILDMSFALENEILKKKEVKVAGNFIIPFHTYIILHTQKMSFKQKLKNPWLINVSEYLCRDLFYNFFRAVRDYKIAYGRTCEIVYTKKVFPRNI